MLLQPIQTVIRIACVCYGGTADCTVVVCIHCRGIVRVGKGNRGPVAMAIDAPTATTTATGIVTAARRPEVALAIVC